MRTPLIRLLSGKVFDGEDEPGVHPRVKPEAVALLAGSGRCRCRSRPRSVSTLDVAAVAHDAERGFVTTAAAASRIGGSIAGQPGIPIRSGNRDRPPTTGARPGAHGARRAESNRPLRGDAQVTFASIEQHARISSASQLNETSRRIDNDDAADRYRRRRA